MTYQVKDLLKDVDLKLYGPMKWEGNWDLCYCITRTFGKISNRYRINQKMGY